MNNAEFNLAEESCSAGSAVSASSALWTWAKKFELRYLQVIELVMILVFCFKKPEIKSKILFKLIEKSRAGFKSTEERCVHIVSLFKATIVNEHSTYTTGFPKKCIQIWSI